MSRVVILQGVKFLLSLMGVFFLSKILIPYNVSIATVLFLAVIFLAKATPSAKKFNGYIQAFLILSFIYVMTYANLYSAWITYAVVALELLLRQMPVRKNTKKYTEAEPFLQYKHSLQIGSVLLVLLALLLNEHSSAGMRIEEPMLLVANLTMIGSVVIGLVYLSRVLSLSYLKK